MTFPAQKYSEFIKKFPMIHYTLARKYVEAQPKERNSTWIKHNGRPETALGKISDSGNPQRKTTTISVATFGVDSN